MLGDVILREKLRANGLKTAEKFDVKRMISSVREMYRLVHSESVERTT